MDESVQQVVRVEELVKVIRELVLGKVTAVACTDTFVSDHRKTEQGISQLGLCCSDRSERLKLLCRSHVAVAFKDKARKLSSEQRSLSRHVVKA